MRRSVLLALAGLTGALAGLAPAQPAAAGDAANGERLFRACSFCHTLTPESGRRAGPSLWNVFGRRAGTLDGYRYSPALKDSSIVWTEETLGRLFEVGPETMTPGSKMPLQLIPSPDDRADLIAYLRTATAPR